MVQARVRIAHKIKNDRIAFRTTEEEKALIHVAASLTTDGDVTAFVLQAVRERVERTMERQRATLLNAEQWRRFQELVADPPEPSPRLVALFANKRHRIVE